MRLSSKMCSRFYLLYSIDTKTVEEILPYLKRLSLIYLIFGLISLTAVFASPTFYSISGVAALIILSGGLRYVYDYPSSTSAAVGIFSLILYIIYKLVLLALLIIAPEENSLGIILGVVGLLLSASTIYIVIRLREKLVTRERQQEQGGGYAVDEESQKPVVVVAHRIHS